MFAAIQGEVAEQTIYRNLILVVFKDRPEWQRGKANLPGGKIEPGETPITCAERELEEETGLKSEWTEVLGKIVGSYGVVYCVKCGVEYAEPEPRKGETEVVKWVNWEEIANSSIIIPNLRAVIPMMMQGVKNFVVADEGPSKGADAHTFAITMKV